MSLKIIELNDGAIKIGNQNGIVARSPGFALVVGNDLVLGQEAEEQARLQPTKSYNKYWHELSMEPLNHDNHLRHTADIAFAHLLHLAEIGEIDSDVMLAVPGSFSNQQLAILLGLAKQSPLNPIGVVDSALAAAAAVNADEPALFVDFQLHQTVVTTLNFTNGLMTAESAIQIPGAGRQNFINLMMQQATDLFIEQCRFNPQHNAEYEQLLYNQLPAWLNQFDDSQTNLVLELKTNDALHTAKMPKEGLIASLQGHYKKINQELEPLLRGNFSNIILNQSLATMPGYVASLPPRGSMHILQDDEINIACLDNVSTFRSSKDGIHLVRSLPLSRTTTHSTMHGKATTNNVAVVPTHLLFRNQAMPLNGVKIHNQQANTTEQSSGVVAVDGGDRPPELGRFTLKDGSVFIDSGEQEFMLNSKPAKGLHKISLGDRIQFEPESEQLTAIQVQNV